MTTIHIKVRDLRQGDTFDSLDGRGIEKVTSVQKSGRGQEFRFVRTTRCDHNWAADKVVEVTRHGQS
jgi:nitrogen regulatory protein PII